MFLALISAGNFLVAPAMSPEKADLIILLGGGTGSRTQAAADMYTHGYASRIVLTGLENGYPATRPVYLEWRARYLVDVGVPESALIFDRASSNTWQEAVSTLRLMQRMGMNRVMVVSDPPHMRRLSWVWNRVFTGTGLHYRLIASPMPGWDAGHWWRDEKSAQFVLMELIKLGYYLVRH